MSIKRLRIQHLRNIDQAELEFSDRINLIDGKNGSGKSTLLEAIYMIGRGRSYRSAKFGSVIAKGAGQSNLFAESANGQGHKIGIMKTPQTTQVRVDGQNVTKLSAIARLVPLQILTPMSHAILERGPDYRRRFLEWGVFHVEHEYFSIHRNYSQALRQRNAALKTDRGRVAVWNPPIAKYGEWLNQLRESYFVELDRAFHKELEALGIANVIEMSWRRGWDPANDLGEVLDAQLESDLRRGFTQSGPHRADFRLTFDQRSAFNAISRGQQKMIISALHLAQASVIKAQTDQFPLLLFDDLVSELDHEHRGMLIGRIHQLGCQAFITSIDPLECLQADGVNRITIDEGRIVGTTH